MVEIEKEPMYSVHLELNEKEVVELDTEEAQP
jgi:hypothetical protein